MCYNLFVKQITKTPELRSTVAFLQIMMLAFGFFLALLQALSVSAQNNILCYYNYGRASILPIDLIDANLCTHLIYSFALLDPNSLLIVPGGEGDGVYGSFTALKQRNSALKVLIAIGGGEDSNQGDKYSRLVRDPGARQAFVGDSIQFLRRYGFDGLDLDWEIPRNEEDKAGFSNWVRELKGAFSQEGLLLTAALNPLPYNANMAYNIPEISQYLDFLNLMAYDMHGASWEPTVARHHAKLRRTAGDDDPNTVEDVVQYFINNGAPAGKIIVGIPIYGHGWTLTTDNVVPPAAANGPAARGENMEYTKICQLVLQEGWTEVKDGSNSMGPYAYQGNQWYGYDDPDIVVAKRDFVRNRGLAGVMFWELSQDDVNGNSCNRGTFPIVNAARK